MSKQNKPKPLTIEQIKQERDKLLISRDNPERLAELQAKLDYFWWGIKNKC